MKKIRTLLTIFLALVIPLLHAQERQIPFFPEQDIVTIDKGYAKKMALFENYQNFEEAKMYLLPEGQYAVEIFYRLDGDLIKDRLLLDEIEREEFLENLVQQYADQLEKPVEEAGEITLLNQKGRPAMLVMNTITGLSYYGPALPIMMDVQEPKAFVGLYMVAAGTSFAIPYMATSQKNVTLGQASFTFYGQSRGILHGWTLGELMTKELDYESYGANYEQYDRDRDRQTRIHFAMGALGSISMGITGHKLAEKWDYEGGSTSIFQMWGDVGTISGLLATDVLDLWDPPNTNGILASSFIGAAAGMTVGKYFADTRDYTLGDAIVYRSTIALSCFAPVTLVHYFEPKETSAYTLAGLAGIAAGSYFGWKATQNRNFSTAEGVFIALGEVAGGLLGLGTGYLIAPENSDGKLILTSTTLGAFLGYGIMYAQFHKKAMQLPNSVKLDFNINPLGLLMNSKKPIQPELMSMYSLANIRVTF